MANQKLMFPKHSLHILYLSTSLITEPSNVLSPPCPPTLPASPPKYRLSVVLSFFLSRLCSCVCQPVSCHHVWHVCMYIPRLRYIGATKEDHLIIILGPRVVISTAFGMASKKQPCPLISSSIRECLAAKRVLLSDYLT